MTWPKGLTLKVAGGAVLLVAAALVASSLLASRDAEAELRATIAAQKDVIAKLDAEMQARDQQAANQVNQLRAMAQKVTTPTLAVQALPQVVDLPVAIYLRAPLFTSPAGDAEPTAPALPDAPSAAVIPAESVVPLYQRLAKCAEDDVLLAACQAGRADLEAKVEALETERDAAVKAARGGGFWKRLKANGKWFLLGAGAGAGLYAATRGIR